LRLKNIRGDRFSSTTVDTKEISGKAGRSAILRSERTSHRRNSRVIPGKRKQSVSG
jgi:hypothetical protein